MKGTAIAIICAVALVHAEINENGCPINPTLDILKPHPICNKYYQCTQGVLFERQCASTLVFNVEIQECDWAEKVDCEYRVPAGPDSSEEASQPDNGGANSDPSLAPEICAVAGSDGLLVAHENCNKFYECANGAPVAQKCASTLLFNPSIGKCDWPENVECGDRNPDGGDGGGNNDPSLAPQICAAAGSDGILVAHENCNQFYECSDGAPVALTCSGNLLFNPAKDQCDWPENVECGDRNPDGGDGGGNNDPSLAPQICAAAGSDGILVAHENCNQFYECSDGAPVALTCSGNLLFNPAKDQCDWPENVNCGDRNPEGGNNGGDGGSGDDGNGDSGNGDGVNSDPGQAGEICAAEGSDGILVAHENCNQFYKCSEGKPVAMDCPLNLLYNPSKQQCDWPENVNCADRTPDNGGENEGDNDNDNGSGGNSDPNQAAEICASEGSDGLLVAHEKCNQFYKCIQGVPVAFGCWGNLLFNPAYNHCDWPENVNCRRNAFRSFNKHLRHARRI